MLYKNIAISHEMNVGSFSSQPTYTRKDDKNIIQIIDKFPP